MCTLLIRVLIIGLDPNPDQHSVGPNLDPSYLQRNYLQKTKVATEKINCVDPDQLASDDLGLYIQFSKYGITF